MDIDIPLVAGALSTIIFVISTLPMLVKASRTRDLSSYSLGNILLSNVGNVVHSIYVFNLPAGPVWALHSFYLVATGLMLIWYVRYTLVSRLATGQAREPGVTRRAATFGADHLRHQRVLRREHRPVFEPR
jgi:uncharacterized protein with PQ loop repeat